jgi:hypothetical protein
MCRHNWRHAKNNTGKVNPAAKVQRLNMVGPPQTLVNE